MSYGLWISDGVNGGVITNSNAITNTEDGLTQAGTIAGLGNIVINNLPGVGDPATIGVTFQNAGTGPTAQDSGLEVSRDLVADTMTITNTKAVPQTYSIVFFRFK